MRLLVRLITTLLGVVVAVAGALLAVEGAWSLLRPDSGTLIVPWSSLRPLLEQWTWNSVPMRVTAAAVAVIGAVLLLVAGRAGRKDIRLYDPAPEVTVTTDPRSLARLVGHRVREQDGVGSASVTATRARVRVRARSAFSSVGVEDLHDRIDSAADEAVRDLPLLRPPRVSVSVFPAKEVS
jgi:hypothetical protein